MPVAKIILTDSVAVRRTYYFIDDASVAHAREVWDDKDRFLASVQDNPVFEGLERWCDLDPQRFMILILMTLHHVADVPEDDVENVSDPAVRSLVFLLSAFVNSLQIRTGMVLDLVKIHRFAENDATFDFSGGIVLDLNDYKPSDKLFEVVVDNE